MGLVEAGDVKLESRPYRRLSDEAIDGDFAGVMWRIQCAVDRESHSQQTGYPIDEGRVIHAKMRRDNRSHYPFRNGRGDIQALQCRGEWEVNRYTENHIEETHGESHRGNATIPVPSKST